MSLSGISCPGGDEIYFVSGGKLMVTSFKAGVNVEIGAPSVLLSSSDHPLRFEAFGQSTYDITPEGHIAAVHLGTSEEDSALLIQNWKGLLGALNSYKFDYSRFSVVSYPTVRTCLA